MHAKKRRADQFRFVLHGRQRFWSSCDAAIDPKTGQLKSAGDPVKQLSPSCIMLLP